MAKFNDPLGTPFSIPESFFNQLGEFTNGYLLFFINNEGSIQASASFGCEVDEIALRNRAMKLLESISAMEDLEIQEGVSGEFYEDDDDED